MLDENELHAEDDESGKKDGIWQATDKGNAEAKKLMEKIIRDGESLSLF